MDYGSGAIFACPAHDRRDLRFAIKYGADVIPGILPKDANLGAHDIQPFAFGLKAIIIAILGIDRDGFATEVENGLNGLDGIQTVVLEEQSLI